MKKKIIELSKESIDEFAERHNLTMEIRQRFHHESPAKWYARFEDAEVKEGCFLIGRYGNGSDPDSAIRNYAAKISGTTLVIQAMHPNRREITVPELVEGR